MTGSWSRYMFVAGAADARRARGELQRLLDELGSLARAHGRAEVAVLLRRDPEAITDRDPKKPTLDDFRDSHPPDFYTEAELIELHQAKFGRTDSRSPERRRQRLRERQVAAIQWLESVGARAPQPADPVAAWLDDRVAGRLAAVGIQRLGELSAWIRTRGFNWHRAIPKIGPEGAARVVRWLREHEATLGALPSAALQPHGKLDTAALTPTPRTGIVPLERFKPPPEHDGATGTNRAPVQRCGLAAGNDFEAVQAWLRLRPQGTHTWRAYRKEAERFLLWAIMEQRKALASLDGDDCVAYRDFIAAPGPAWTGPRNAQRWSEAWRPFEGPLSARSQASAVTIVRSMCEWLVRRHYLGANPWDDLPARPNASSMPQRRALSHKQWALVQGWLGEQAPSPALGRLRFMMDFAYLTGMRLAELAAAQLGWLRHKQPDDGERAWSIMVLGRRNKWREVPLPDAAVDAVRQYLQTRDLCKDPLANPPETPLIAKLNLEAPLTAARIYEVLVTGFTRCAADVAANDRRAADTISAASTHWLRHTCGSHSVARGVSQHVLQANLGHESVATTSIYVRAEKGCRHRAGQTVIAGLPLDPRLKP